MIKPNRKRNWPVSFRMTDEEHKAFVNRVIDSGLSQQSFIINSVLKSRTTSVKEIETLKDINRTFGDYIKQIRGLATNVNQMAHVANGQGVLPTVKELQKISEALENHRKETEPLWQSIRSSISQQRHTVR